MGGGDFHRVAEPSGDLVKAGAGLCVERAEGVAHGVPAKGGSTAGGGEALGAPDGIPPQAMLSAGGWEMARGDQERAAGVERQEVRAGGAVERDGAGALVFRAEGGGGGDCEGSPIGGEMDPCWRGSEDLADAESAMESQYEDRAQIGVRGGGNHVVPGGGGQVLGGAGGVRLGRGDALERVGSEEAGRFHPGGEGAEVAPQAADRGRCAPGGAEGGEELVRVLGGEEIDWEIPDDAGCAADRGAHVKGVQEGGVPAGAGGFLQEPFEGDGEREAGAEGGARGEQFAVGGEGGGEVVGAECYGGGSVSVDLGRLVVPPSSLAVESAGERHGKRVALSGSTFEPINAGKGGFPCFGRSEQSGKM